MSEALTVQEAAEVLRLHPESIRRLCVEKRIFASKVGKRWLILREEVEEVLRTGLRRAA